MKVLRPFDPAPEGIEHPPIKYSAHDVVEIMKAGVSDKGNVYISSTTPSPPPSVLIAKNWHHDKANNIAVNEGGAFAGEGYFKFGVCVSEMLCYII